MKNKIKSDIEYIGLTYKIEKIKIVVASIIGILSSIFTFFLTKQILMCGLVLTIFLIFIYLLISSYSNKKALLIKSRNEEFVYLLSYFQVFITNGSNVYQAFKKCLSVSSPWLNERIELLLTEIDNDKTIKPFINFGNNFSISSASNVMFSIFQMIEVGENKDSIYHFLFLYKEINSQFLADQKENKKSSLSNVTVFPLVGAGYITLVLGISIVSIVGELINVI